MNLREEIELATGSHAQWKRRLRQALDIGVGLRGLESMKPGHLCEFGRWLHGPGLSPEERASAHFQAVDRLHEEFHREATTVIDLALAGEDLAALKALGSGGTFHEASRRLIHALKAWHESL